MARSSTWLAALALFAASLAPGCGGDGAGGAGGSNDHEPCCGCLCADPTWSCSKDTCLDADGHATLSPEAGFFELPGADFTSYAGPGKTPRERVWYSFQPAEVRPESKPLVIVMQSLGGPTLGLLGFNIGHYTFDIDFTNGKDFADNPSRWTEFANLLFVDAPDCGYSYDLPRADGSAPPVAWDAYAEAGDFLRVLFRFVARHPALAKSPVILVGESGSGTRAVHMTKIMLDYPTLVASGQYQDAELHDEILAFLGARRTDIAPSAWQPADIAAVFTHVFIEPTFSPDQYKHLEDPTTIPECIDGGSVLECDVTTAELQPANDLLLKVATSPALIGQVLRTDVTTIAWMHADARTGAIAREDFSTQTIDTSKFVATFGKLEPGDLYYSLSNKDVHDTWDIYYNVKEGKTALRALHDIRTFSTRAKLDIQFNAEFIPPSLATYTKTLASGTLNPAAPKTAPRPGQIELVYRDTVPYGGGTVIIPNPLYLAGHSVSHKVPDQLARDVRAFLGL
jgi:Serine carboxypeptidase